MRRAVLVLIQFVIACSGNLASARDSGSDSELRSTLEWLNSAIALDGRDSGGGVGIRYEDVSVEDRKLVFDEVTSSTRYFLRHVTRMVIRKRIELPVAAISEARVVEQNGQFHVFIRTSGKEIRTSETTTFTELGTELGEKNYGKQRKEKDNPTATDLINILFHKKGIDQKSVCDQVVKGFLRARDLAVQVRLGSAVTTRIDGGNNACNVPQQETRFVPEDDRVWLYFRLDRSSRSFDP